MLCFRNQGPLQTEILLKYELRVSPKILYEFLDIDSRRLPNGSDYVFGSFVIEVLIPFRKARFRKLLKKDLLYRMLGVLQASHHV
jgi:hypothetical protein